MTLHAIQLVSGLLLTFLGMLAAFVLNIETSRHEGETSAIITVAVANLLWLFPSVLYIRRKHIKGAMARSLVVFCLFWFPFIALRLHDPAFDSVRWKSELNPNYGLLDHDGREYPAHRNGAMCASIIKSDTLIGKSLQQIEELLGEDHITQVWPSGDSIRFYFYSNWNPFDGCNKLAFKMRDGRCVFVNYYGCD